MPFDNVMSRNLVAALSTEEVSRDLLQALNNESAALTRFRRVTMSRNQTRMPVLSALPMAYFVNGDTGLKQSTQVEWENLYLNVEEVAVILPIPEAVLDDSEYDIWGEVRPLAIDAAAQALDAAVFFGVNKPSSWPDAIAPTAITKGNEVERGTADPEEGGLAADISNAFSEVEKDGFAVTGAIANIAYRGYLRNARDNEGRQLSEVGPNEIYGTSVGYPMPGLWPAGSGEPELILGDFSRGILGIRQDFTWKLLDQAVIQDNTGATVFNLPQQDMIALRLVFRVAFQVANTINYQEKDETSRYPFAVVTAP